MRFGPGDGAVEPEVELRRITAVEDHRPRLQTQPLLAILPEDEQGAARIPAQVRGAHARLRPGAPQLAVDQSEGHARHMRCAVPLERRHDRVVVPREEPLDCLIHVASAIAGTVDASFGDPSSPEHATTTANAGLVR